MFFHIMHVVAIVSVAVINSPQPYSYISVSIRRNEKRCVGSKCKRRLIEKEIVNLYPPSCPYAGFCEFTW
jgi:hypothetical protein